MKRFYFIFFAVCLAFVALMYYSAWWFIGAIAAAMAFVAYRFYAIRLESMQVRNQSLEEEVDQLHEQLDVAVRNEMQKSREAREVRELKQQLLSVINHEVRTPMNGIMGMALLLSDTSLTEEQKEYTAQIRQSGESLLATVNQLLVNDILHFSKLEQQETLLDNKPFDPEICVQEVIAMFAARTAQNGIDLMYDIDLSVPEQLIGDSRRIQQVLMNILENAVRLTDHGEIVVRVASESVPAEANKTRLTITVTDTGKGLTRDEAATLFKGVRPANVGSDEQALGLVACKKLIDLMNGSVEVKSIQGEGTTITVAIPLTIGESAQYQPAGENKKRHDEVGVLLAGKDVLIIEENTTQRKLLAGQLEHWRMKVAAAADIATARNVLSSGRPADLILLDRGIGLEQAALLSKEYPACRLVLLNQPGEGNLAEYAQLFSAIVPKPVSRTMLADRLVEALGSRPNGDNAVTPGLTTEFSKQFPLKILLAEDNKVNQKLATKVLAKLGYVPDLANDGREVMEIVGNEHYDIILMDVEMPVMDGLEATRMIRTCLAVQPVIIALTANVMLGDRDACIQAGMDDYISKPIELNGLLGQLQKWWLIIQERRKVSA